MSLAPRRASMPLWKCPRCGRTFANRNQSHACGRSTLAQHFVGKPPRARELFDALAELLRACGPLEVLPEKTRIAFHVRMSFAAVSVRRDYLVGHLVLARRVTSRHFLRIDTISPRNHVHVFRLASLDQLDAEFARLAREAYAVGEQRHLGAPARHEPARPARNSARRAPTETAGRPRSRTAPSGRSRSR